MILSRDEAVSLVLFFSDRHTIFSSIKLNKLLARLNLYFIPVDINFSLNKYGSYNADLSNLQETEYYEVKLVSYMGRTVQKLALKRKGEALAQEVAKKLQKIMTPEELNKFRNEIYDFSQYRAEEISDNEHKELLVDVDDKFKLKQKINEIHIELYDFYALIDKIPPTTITNIQFRALIEYCYYLTKYLKERRFKNLDDNSKEYDFDAYMLDYYFVNLIHKYIIPFLKEQIKLEKKDPFQTNKFYNFLVDSVKDRYPFSLYNKDLKEIIVR